jgi:hypothetical protein
VNDAHRLAPWADICYFADYRWWEWHHKDADFAAFAGQKCTIQNSGGMVRDAEVFMLHNLGSDKLSETPNGLNTGSNGGYQAVNIATLAGAAKVLLIGYDMHFPAGRSHWHAGHPVKVPEDRYSQYARSYKTMLPQLAALGVEVVNCTPGSRIDAFRFSDLKTELGFS